MNKPNILLIITDQQRTDTLGFRKETPCHTPNINRLFETGVSFDKCITPSPLCTPARASIFTGLYPHQVKGRLPGDGGMFLDDPIAASDSTMMTNYYTIDTEPIFPKLMKEKGYHLDYAGKWHLGDEAINDWFDRACGYDNAEYSKWCEEKGLEDGWAFNDYSLRSKMPPYMSTPKTAVMNIDPQYYGDAYITDKAIDYIKTRPQNKPFFTVCSVNGPHPPFKLPEKYLYMYDPECVKQPANFNHLEGKPKSATESYYHKMVEEFGTEWDKWKESFAAYWGFVSLVDEQVGRLLSCLQEENIINETLVIFISDHGEFLGQHGLWHKMYAYEEAVRVPMIFSAPWIENGIRSNAGATLVDLVPTILAAAGISIPEGLQGKNLYPVLTGEEKGEEDRFLYSEHRTLGVWHNAVDWRMITDNKYKYIWNNGDIDELYHLESDPNELKNLIHDKEYEDVSAQYKEQLKQWMKDTNDPLYSFIK